ncbi:hypothetical protein AB0B89_23570, partial [Sphaerisporangium sp. NPDC049002]|uniref:hypothetical protein n=1 Tax=Sphaerisporangium sp. NPDC049002 TaxID=3155392 RepID=UPI0033E5D598
MVTRRRTLALVAALTLLGGCAAEPPAVKNNTTVPTAAAEIGGKVTMWYDLDSNDEKSVKEFEKWYIEPYKKMYPKARSKKCPRQCAMRSSPSRT